MYQGLLITDDTTVKANAYLLQDWARFTGGRNGVHLAIHPAGRFIVIANYATGSVSVVPIAADGTLAAATQVATLQWSRSVVLRDPSC